MLNQRTSPRRKMVLPVKVTFDTVNHLAHTIDLTHTGARLGGLRTPLQPGMIITLQRGSKKAKIAPNELQAGVESLEPPNDFWGVDLSAQEHATKQDVKAFMTFLSG